MIRKEIIERIKELDLKVLRWQVYNNIWNDLKYKYGITEEEFQIEINRMVEEETLVPLKQKSNYMDYKINYEQLSNNSEIE